MGCQVNPPILCYISEPWAYFTTQDLKDQWGDDWDDAPYEHNAGTPYEHRNEDSTPKWKIIKVAYDGDFETPRDCHTNSPYSVKRINAGAIPWLVTSRWTSKPIITIPAGTPLDQFLELVSKAGGTVFTPHPSFTTH